MDVFLWGILPYLVIATLVLGTIWRHRYDKFGWTTRSSQLYESRLLRIGSPLFHFGILVVFIGHIGGLVIPEDWTEAVGISEGMYHFNALLFGGIAGFCTLVGILILVVRRRMRPRSRDAGLLHGAHGVLRPRRGRSPSPGGRHRP